MSSNLSAMLQTDFLENEESLGTREAYEKHLATVPGADPIHTDDVIK